MTRVVPVAFACVLLAVASYVVLFGDGPLRMGNPDRLIAAVAVGAICAAVAGLALRR